MLTVHSGSPGDGRGYVLTGSRLEQARAVALENYAPLVHRERRFEVHLAEYEWRRKGLSDTPETFIARYERNMRPLLEQVEYCRVFPKKPGSRQPVGRFAKWEQAGARPDEWRARYLRNVEGELEIDLRPEVLDDKLFWWWMFPGGAPFWTVFFTTMGRFDAAAYFARVEDPTCIRNWYKDSSGILLKFGKEATSRNDRLALRLHASMTLSVIASPPNVERLFRLAVEHAIFNF